MNKTVDWQVFDYKFANNKQEMFEDLASLIFSRMFSDFTEISVLAWEEELRTAFIDD